MKRGTQYIMTALAIAVLAAGISGCGSKEEAAAPAQLVRTQRIGGPSAGQDEDTYAGTVRGRYESNLSFQIGGRITSRNVQMGSSVHAGDALMTIDPKDAAQAVYQTQAQVQAAQAQLELAQANLARYRQLFAQDAVSAAALDQYQTAYDQAQAQYQQAQAAQQAQENQLSYTTLTADADGVISSVTGEVGQVVAAGQTMLTLVHNGDLEVQINVPENKLADFPIGRDVTVSFWALTQETAGVVREVSPMADLASRTYKVCITVPNPPQGMQLGMTASVHNGSSSSASASAVELPLSAIYQTGDTPQVWVVGADHTVSLKAVTVAEFGSDSVRVTGLSAGDQVVTAGVHMLKDGQTVRIEGDDT